MNEITFHDEVSAAQPAGTLRTEKRWLLFVYVPIFVIVFLVVGIIFDDQKGLSNVIDLVFALGMNISAFAWCRMDSRERGYELHRFFPFAIVILGTLALLYYLFRSRGFLGSLVSIGWLILYFALCIGGAMVISIIILLGLVFTGVLPTDVFN